LEADIKSEFTNSRSRLAKTKIDTIVTPASPIRFVYPNENNLHTFKANSSSAFFDILTPPYDEDNDRPCKYYRPRRISNTDGIVELMETEFGDFVCNTDPKMPKFNIQERELEMEMEEYNSKVG